MEKILVITKEKREVIDITDDVGDLLRDLGVKNGLCSLLVAHTTAALTTADLGLGTDLDMLNAFEAMVPKLKYSHDHDPEHAPDHIMSSIIGPSLSILVEDGLLQMGNYQRIVLVEFNGPRNRDVIFSFLPDNG